MYMYKFILHIISLISVSTLAAVAQQAPPPDTAKGAPAVKVQARAYQDHIKLRWAPNTPIAWQYANQYGYQVEKYLVYQNGEILAKPQKVNLTKSNFKPLPLKAWEKVVRKVGKENENYALVAAQALYGKAFGLTTAGKNVSNLKKIINQVREQEMRFAYALMASDHSLPVAEASGLYLKDNSTKKAEKYLYKVYVKLPAAINYKIDTGYVYTGVDDYEALPKPVEFSATFGNRTVMLTWNRWYYERFYVAYWVERSADGGVTYQKVTNAPIGNVLQEEVGIRSRFLYRIDSLPKNEVTYHYQVRGVNSFGEVGPPSEAISGQGWENNLPLPKLIKPTLQNDGTVRLEWTFPAEQEKDIVGFVIEKARRASGATYKLVHPNSKTLPPTTRNFTDPKVDGVNYYRLGIVSKKPFKGEEKSVSQLGGKQVNHSAIQPSNHSNYVRYTFPFLVQVPDSIPPQAPTMVAGVIDSTGKVTLRWKASPDDDVQGYRVYRANYAGEQFSQVTKSLVNDTVFIDSVGIKTLTTKVLYKVQAVDEYINPSEFSKVGVLRRPDVIPPVSPVFTQVISADSGVYLGWQVSTSVDVARHALYRQERGKSNEWVLIKNILDTAISVYNDVPPKTGVDYQYTIVAVDSSSLESLPAKPVIGRRIDNGLRGKIKKLKAAKTGDKPATIALNWELEVYENQGTINPESFSIYRGEELGNIRLYATVKGDARTWKDAQLKRGTSYKYRIQANFKRGAVSKFSELVVVKF